MALGTPSPPARFKLHTEDPATKAMTMNLWLLLVNLLATLALVGVIWFLQIVQYPLLASVGRDRFARYEEQQQQRTGYVVAPLMLVEAVSALLLVGYHPRAISPQLAWIGLAIVVAMWLLTFFWQLPLHARLAKAYDRQAHRRLVCSNWFRTAGWTLRGALVVLMLTRVLA